ncbi:MAG: glycosyltransferase family 39 protein [Candidatus Thermoplasmatota archaeon]|nr:glycosyltransferase family 39 protein [Candidatus Thermoplasmatota archaeon]
MDNKTMPYAFLVVLSAAILIRFLLGPLKTGAYIDEFYHLFSGLHIMEHGTTAQVYRGSGGYYRGLYVSYLVAFFFNSFGKSIFVARLVPFLVGMMNLLLLYVLARRITDRIIASFALLIFSLEPLMIFIHTYIREYVFIQFFAILSLLILFYLRRRYLQDGYFSLNKKNILSIAGLIFFNGICLAFTNSLNKYSAILVVVLFVILFLLEINYDRLTSLTHRKKFAILISLLVLAVITAFTFRDIQKVILGGVFVHGMSLKPGPFSFTGRLLYTYGPFLILFIIGGSMAWKEKDKELLYLTSIFLIIYLLYEFSNINWTIEGRFIAFSLPIFFIVASKGIPVLFEGLNRFLERFTGPTKFPSNQLFSGFVLMIVLIAALFSAYPAPESDDAPSLPGPPYKDWGEATSYLRQHVRRNDTVISIPAHGAEFSGPKPDYTIMTGDWDYANRTRGYRDGQLVYLMTGTPVLNSTEELNKVFNESDRIWIIYSADYLSKWSNDRIVDFVKNRTTRVKRSKNWVRVQVLVYQK